MVNHRQCDQMATLFLNIGPFAKLENMRNTINVLPKWIENFAKAVAKNLIFYKNWTFRHTTDASLKVIFIKISFKGTVQREVWPSVFFIIRISLGH